jgi:peptidoglycan/xylan/chitin deacetylase (PgdA/CDA1 family)
MFNWINGSEQVFSKILNKPTVGFRSPAGIITPELIWALKELKLPLIHWSVRFFDTRRLWTEKKALCAVDHLKRGDIILLHDVHRQNTDHFTNTLGIFIKAAKDKGFSFLPISGNP